MERKDPVRYCKVTADGRGAIATTVVWGRDAASWVDQFFQPHLAGRRIARAAPGDLIYGLWQASTGEGAGYREVAEDVVVCVTHPECVEIHSHGGDWSSKVIAGSLERLGALETSATALLSEREPSFWIRELQQALLHVETERMALWILDQISVWRAAARRWADCLHKRDWESIELDLRHAQAVYPVTRHIVEPWKVVLCGPPNAGKSSLINAVVGFLRTIVDETPGTTRDVVRQRTVIDGWVIELSDTAGVRKDTEELETEAIRRGVEEALRSDCLIGVIDGSLSERPDIRQLIPGRSLDIEVWNKMDLCHRESVPSESLAVSARTGMNLDLLLKRITDILIPEPPPVDRPLLVTAAMAERLEDVLAVRQRSGPEAAGKQLLALSAG